MTRTILTLALSMFLLAEASAQTTPATTTKAKAKSAKAVARISRRNAKKAQRAAIKSAPAPVAYDGWPPIEDAKTAVAVASTTDNGWDSANTATASTNRGEIDNANVYAAPGMPVHMRTGNGLVPYSVRPARKAASQTTLSGN